jgi:hypothetical protein
LGREIEAARPLLKEKLTKKDEGALFQLLNEYDLRHKKLAQKDDYDPVFLDWMFAWFLASVRLVRELTQRDAEASSRDDGRSPPG